MRVLGSSDYTCTCNVFGSRISSKAAALGRNVVTSPHTHSHKTPLVSGQGLERLVQDTQNLQRRADDITKNLTGRRDNVNPMYRGDDDSSD